VERFEEVEPKLDPHAIRANAERFSLEEFRAGITRAIDEVCR